MFVMRQGLVENAGHRLFVLLGTITLLLATAMTIGVIRFRSYSRLFANTHEVLNAITSLEASATRVENSARAYFLTGDDTFLHEFEEGRNTLVQDRELLGSLVAGTDQEKPDFARLSSILTERVRHLSDIVGQRRNGLAVSLPAGVHHEEGVRLGRQIAQMIRVEKAHQEMLLAQRRSRRRRIENAILAFCITGALVSLALVLVGMRSMRNDLRLRDQAQEALRKSNLELERRVQERTASIQQANADLQQSQNDLRAIAAALERSNTDLESFAYAATHDLQEPLRTITLFAQMLQNQSAKAPSDAAYYLNTIVKAADRMTELINGMLEYSRITRDQFEAAEPVDLNDVVAEVEENLSAQINESGARISHPPLPSLPGSHMHLTRLMQNLIGNSIKYRSPDRPCEIKIEAHRENDHWAVSVRDNGMGFKSEYQEYIFGMFKRLDRARAGAGVGLATCQTIIERYGGKIWAESEEGRGATFHFKWPVARAKSSAN